ncbi:Ubiquitin-like protein 3 [Thoreauomyces humboldtii]|nr:Ubiquitin-like protein 3 [Thoreauomyces humboldtii]
MADPELPLSETNTVDDTPEEAVTPVVVNAKVPADKVNLRFLLISGRRTDLLCNAGDTIEDVKARIHAAWPTEWADERPSSPAQLRVLHQGKFFEPANTLESYKLAPGQTTTVHLLLKTGAATADEEKAKPDTEQAAGCRCCTIM